jgi:hypothetical protein
MVNDFDPAMSRILSELIENDDNVTARAVARLHPTIRHASTITRSPERSAMLAQAQVKQEQLREWKKRTQRRSQAKTLQALVQKDERIAQLQMQVEVLRASHIAMIRAVGELGGTAKWVKLFDGFSKAREELRTVGAMPNATVTPLRPEAESEVNVPSGNQV